MLKFNLKQLFIFIALVAVSCDSSDSNPMAPEEHTDAEGLILEHNEQEVYREFQGEVTVNTLSLAINSTLELSVHFLDDYGNEIEHEEEHENGEEEDELTFTNYDNTVISLELEEHCDEITDQTECTSSEHCEWHTDESLCEDENHDEGEEDHHEMGFELTGLSTGTTNFTISLMHDGHADYTSLPISVTVE